MEILYWAMVVLVDFMVIKFLMRWTYRKTKEIDASSQAPATVCFAIGIAMVVIAITVIAYFVSVDFLGMKPPITHK